MKREDLLYSNIRSQYYVDRLTDEVIATPAPDLGLKTVEMSIPASCNCPECSSGSAALALDIPIIPNLASKILEVINIESCNLRMEFWHTCATTHCLAGWAIHLAGKQGYKLQDAVENEAIAGKLLFEAAGIKLEGDSEEPDIFFKNEETALEWLKEQAEKGL